MGDDAMTDKTLTNQQISILNHMVKDMGYQGVWCFYVPPGQNIEGYGAYIPAMVFRDVQSYFSMNGPLYGDVPFVLGKNLDEAREMCRLMNRHIGLDEETVRDILDSAGLAAG